MTEGRDPHISYPACTQRFTFQVFHAALLDGKVLPFGFLLASGKASPGQHENTAIEARHRLVNRACFPAFLQISSPLGIQ